MSAIWTMNAIKISNNENMVKLQYINEVLKLFSDNYLHIVFGYTML